MTSACFSSLFPSFSIPISSSSFQNSSAACACSEDIASLLSISSSSSSFSSSLSDCILFNFLVLDGLGIVSVFGFAGAFATVWDFCAALNMDAILLRSGLDCSVSGFAIGCDIGVSQPRTVMHVDNVIMVPFPASLQSMLEPSLV
jgi:hypothetical protein